MAVDLNYGIGVEGKNLVLKTLGKVYVKVKDRKYELAFRPEDIQKQIEQYVNGDGDIKGLQTAQTVVLESSDEINNMDYPGDNLFILTKDGYLYYTEGNNYTEIPVHFSDTSLTLENLIITNQINFTGSRIPFVLNTSTLIPNLNAEFLNGYRDTSFAKKAENETITGQWTHSGRLIFNEAIGQRTLSDSLKNRINIDFINGSIFCNSITTNRLNVTNSEEEDPLFSTISGIGKEVWVGVQTNINDINTYEISDEDKYKFPLVQMAYEAEELPNEYVTETTGIEWPLEDFWYKKIFFDSYDTNTFDYQLKDFDDPDVWNQINANFDGTPYSLYDFQSLIDALKDSDMSQFTGDYYNIDIPATTTLLSFLPNMIVKTSSGQVGVIIARFDDSIIVQALNNAQYFQGNYLIHIGSLINKSSICFNGQNPSISILKDCLNQSSANVYFGELSKIDENKTGIGIILNGTYPENILADNQLETFKEYIHTSEINIQNPYIKWGEDIISLNEDGSGYLSQGQIRWSANKDLLIEDSEISKSSFLSGIIDIKKDGSGKIGDLIEFNTTAVTLNSPLGPAGGDLIGDYPNPTIKDESILEKHLSQEVKDLIGSGGGGGIVEIPTEFREQVENNAQNISDLEKRVTNLENLVGTLNTLLENRLNGN